MKVRYTPRAFADREEIFAYLDERNPRAAQQVKAFIKNRIASLTHSPRRSALIKELGRALARALPLHPLLPGR